MGELLKQFDGRGGDQSKSEGAHTFASDQPSQKEVAERAGISPDQQKQAVVGVILAQGLGPGRKLALHSGLLFLYTNNHAEAR